MVADLNELRRRNLLTPYGDTKELDPTSSATFIPTDIPTPNTNAQALPMSDVSARLRDLLENAPTKEQYAPSKKRRILGGILGGLTGATRGGEAGAAAAEDVIDAPFRRATEQFQSQVTPLLKLDELERLRGKDDAERQNAATAAFRARNEYDPTVQGNIAFAKKAGDIKAERPETMRREAVAANVATTENQRKMDAATLEYTRNSIMQSARENGMDERQAKEIADRVLGRMQSLGTNTVNTEEGVFQFNPKTGKHDIRVGSPVKSVPASIQMLNMGELPPDTDPNISDAARRAYSKSSSPDRAAGMMLIRDQLARGDIPAAKNTIKKALLERQPQVIKLQVQGRREAAIALMQIQELLKGVPQGLLSGTIENIAERLGTTTDPTGKMGQVKTELLSLLQSYRNGVTGKQFSAKESDEYKGILPDFTNEKALNQSHINGMLNALTRGDRSFWEQELGLGWGDSENAWGIFKGEPVTGHSSAAPSIITPESPAPNAPSTAGWKFIGAQ